MPSLSAPHHPHAGNDPHAGNEMPRPRRHPRRDRWHHAAPVVPPTAAPAPPVSPTAIVAPTRHRRQVRMLVTQYTCIVLGLAVVLALHFSTPHHDATHQTAPARHPVERSSPLLPLPLAIAPPVPASQVSDLLYAIGTESHAFTTAPSPWSLATTEAMLPSPPPHAIDTAATDRLLLSEPLPSPATQDATPSASTPPLPNSREREIASLLELVEQRIERAMEMANELPLESLALCVETSDAIQSLPRGSVRPNFLQQHTHLLRALLLGLRVAEPMVSPSQRVESIAVSPNGRRVATACQRGLLQLWDADQQTAITLTEATEHASDRIVGLAFTADERFLVEGRANGTVAWWRTRIENGQVVADRFVFPTPISELHQLALSPDGNWLVATTRDATARCWLWNMATLWGNGRLANTAAWNNPIPLRGHARGVRTIAFSRDSRWIALGGDDGSTRLYDLHATVTGLGVLTLKGHTGSVLSVVIAPDHSWIATGGDDNTIRLWSLADGLARPMGILQGHTGWVSVLAAVPHSSLLLSGGLDQQVIAWDIDAIRAQAAEIGTTLATQIGAVRTMEVSPDGSLVAVLSGTSSLQLWRWDTHRLTDPITLSPRGPEGFPIAAVAFDPHQRLIHAVPDRTTNRDAWVVQRLPLSGDEMTALAREVVARVAASPVDRQ